MYVILDGKVKLGQTSPDGRESLLAVLGPGEVFGELSLFDPGPRTATATAVTDTVVVGLGHADLRPWLTGRPEVAEALLQALAQRLRHGHHVGKLQGQPLRPEHAAQLRWPIPAQLLNQGHPGQLRSEL